MRNDLYQAVVEKLLPLASNHEHLDICEWLLFCTGSLLNAVLILKFKQLTGQTADVFLEYIQRNCPEGVSMDVQQVALEELFLNVPSEAQNFSETCNPKKPVTS